jgi:hypothetical protein
MAIETEAKYGIAKFGAGGVLLDQPFMTRRLGCSNAVTGRVPA